jgi:hypothetical protein
MRYGSRMESSGRKSWARNTVSHLDPLRKFVANAYNTS